MSEFSDFFVSSQPSTSPDATVSEDVEGWQLPLLTDLEYSLLIGQHSFADNIFIGVPHTLTGINDFPQDDTVAQSLRWKVMAAVKAKKQEDCCCCCCCCDSNESDQDMACGCGCGGAGAGGATVTDTGKGRPGSGGSAGGGAGGQTGSGPGGDPNPDGLDKLIVPPGCIPLSAINHPYGSPGFEFSDFSIKSAIAAAVALIPDHKAGDLIVSVMLRIEALGYGGWGLASNQPLISNRKLKVIDGADAERLVGYKEETISGGIITFYGWRYNDEFTVAYGPNDITIDGQLPSSLAPDFNPDKNSPAWMNATVCSAVVRHQADVDMAYGFKYTPLDSVTANFTGSASIAANVLWDDSGTFKRSYADGNLFRAGDTLFGMHDTFEPSNIFMYIPCDKAYTQLLIEGKTISTAQTLHVNVHDRTVGTAVTFADVGSAVVVGTNTPADSSDPAHTPHDVSLSCTFPALTVGHIYQFELYNSGGGTPSWFDMKGTFSGA